jgi:L-threonylcarbamoyladenylate synthase
MSNLSEDMHERIRHGISVLKNGGLVAYPTDTVYGLGAVFDNTDAVEKVYKVKNRPTDMALPLLLADISWISRFARKIPDSARSLIDAFLPGALTLVMLRSDAVPETVSRGKDTVALRVPAHPVTLALIEGVGGPVVGTSANVSGRPSPLTAEEVHNQLGDSVDYIIDGERCPGGTESTIVDITGDVPVIVREGAVPRVEIEKVYRVTTGEER